MTLKKKSEKQEHNHLENQPSARKLFKKSRNRLIIVSLRLFIALKIKLEKYVYVHIYMSRFSFLKNITHFQIQIPTRNFITSKLYFRLKQFRKTYETFYQSVLNELRVYYY